MAISLSSPPGVQREHPSKRWWRSKAIGERSRTVLRPRKSEFGLDHNESRSWHGWYRHVSLVMLAFAMMAAIRHRANPPPLKKPNAEPRQKPNYSHAAFDPLVNPGSPPHRHQTRSEADPTRTRHRMVTLAQGSSGGRSASALQSKTATVMLGLALGSWAGSYAARESRWESVLSR